MLFERFQYKGVKGTFSYRIKASIIYKVRM